MHPYLEFKKAGCDITICSIKGGACHVAAASVAEPAYDAECKSFWENEELKGLTQTTQPLSSYKGTDFKTIFFVGGFGTIPTTKRKKRSMQPTGWKSGNGQSS